MTVQRESRPIQAIKELRIRGSAESVGVIWNITAAGRAELARALQPKA